MRMVCGIQTLMLAGLHALVLRCCHADTQGRQIRMCLTVTACVQHAVVFACCMHVQLRLIAS